MKPQIRLPRSWLTAAGALAVGEAAGLFGARFGAAWPLAAVLATLVALFGFGRAWRGWGAATLALAGLALALHHEAVRGETLRRSDLAGGPFVADLAVVSEPDRRGEWVSFRSETGGVAVEVILPIAEAGLPRLGERWRVAGWLERRARSDRRCRTLWVKGRGTSAVRIGELRCAVGWRLAARLRRRLSKAVGNGLGERRTAAALLRAMLFGERSRLPRAERENFVAAGTMHVFAISGLHVGVVALVIVLLLLAVLVPLRLAGVLMTPILWSYVLLIGFPPSAVRAALMASCYFLAPAFGRRSSGLVAWSQAFVIVHVLNPGALASVGSLLSFAVMLSILLYDRWAEAMNLSGKLRALGLVFAIWAAGAPIAAMTFARLTPGGMLANLAVVPLASSAVICGFLGTLSGFVVPPLGVHLNHAAALIVDAMRGISAAVAATPGSNFELDGWSYLQCALWYLTLLLGAAGLLWLERRSRSQRRLF